VPESARDSPFFESALLYGGPPIDEWAELHILGDQIAAEQLRARNAEILFVDRTLINVVSYWAVRFGHENRKPDLFAATRTFVLEYCRAVYDLIFLLSDRYENPCDHLRETDQVFRRRVEEQLDADLSELGTDVVRMPTLMNTADKVAFISNALTAHGLLEDSLWMP
jgi:hypothetical protein